jgi:hypothetical protein
MSALIKTLAPVAALLILAAPVRVSAGPKDIAVSLVVTPKKAVSKTLAALERFPRWKEDLDEPAEPRHKRLAELAAAIDSAGRTASERAFLVTKAWHESRLAAYVQRDDDRCRLGVGGRCDGGKAFGPIQLQGTERNLTLEEQMTRGVKLFRFGKQRCKARGEKDPVRGAIALFATGNSCEWEGGQADERLQTYKRLVVRL